MSGWYGSVENRIMERTVGAKPEVGMGVTECMWSDRHPWEIIEVKDERHIVIRELKAKRTDKNGMSECQDYEFEQKPDGRTRVLFKNKKGRWVERIGTRGVNDSSGYYIGRAEEYYDYSF